MGNWSLTPLRSSGKQQRTRVSHSSHLRKEVLVFSYTNPFMGCWGWKKGHSFPALSAWRACSRAGEQAPTFGERAVEKRSRCWCQKLCPMWLKWQRPKECGKGSSCSCCYKEKSLKGGKCQHFEVDDSELENVGFECPTFRYRHLLLVSTITRKKVTYILRAPGMLKCGTNWIALLNKGEWKYPKKIKEGDGSLGFCEGWGWEKITTTPILLSAPSRVVVKMGEKKYIIGDSYTGFCNVAWV